ncbi:patatin-like phospholipase family protein [Mycobacterium sp. SMC-2]|uniref:patatin-like phospholipase family protein n=1 Tax=Mycobacterium sp. SMC-2 TaxID=2857058 RepID=UPI0021B46FC5|nr:patatin-like phospholipase family protein [Mycobacterium sp. SMC-2]
MTTERKRVAVVVAGAGARGGYEAGALSVLVPQLRTAGYEPTVYIGTSAGAINATLFAAYAHCPPAEQAGRVLDLWRSISVADVYRSPVLGFPCVAAHLVGQLLRVPGVRFTHLLDTAPLRRKAENSIDIRRLRQNIIEKKLTLAVVATSGDDNRSVVFVDREDGVPVPPSDDDRPIDYVGVHMQPEHVLASSAIPVVFPAVRVQKPSGSAGWFLDGGLRLNTPLKPALSLDVDCLVVVPTHPIRDNTATPKPAPLPPDVDDILVQLLDIVLVDRMVEDLRTLAKVNALVSGKEVTATGRLRRKVPYLFVGPKYRETLGHLATDILHSHRTHSGDVFHRLRQLELDAMGHLLEGDGPRRGDVLSFLYFDQDFIEASIELGQRDAQALFKGLPTGEVRWQGE